jgi:hypothetical protein
MRSTDLPKRGNPDGNIACRERGGLRDRLSASCPKTWMTWIKLDCFKSSSKLETEPSLDITVEVKLRQQHLYWDRDAKTPCREQWSMRPIKLRTGILTHPENVSYDCTAGSPTGREPYGDGDPIVVGGVMTTQGGWDINQPQGEGGQEFRLVNVRRYA